MREDPRDKRFYQLQKKDRSQLNIKDIKEYLRYCDAMINFVKFTKARKAWINTKKELEEIVQKNIP